MRQNKPFLMFLFTGTILAFLCQSGTFSAAQTAAPAALLVPNRFERAVKNQSSAPSYLIATIINDTTGEQKQVCIEGIQLYAGVRKENKLARDDGDKGFRLILGSASRTYHFTSADAWAEVQPRYTPGKLAAVREELRSVSTAELAERFSYARTRGIIKVDETVSDVEFYGYLAATAYVLTERGLLAGRGDFGNSLYVKTPQMLAEADLRDRQIKEYMRRKKAKGLAFAARLRGYHALIKQFTVGNANLSDFMRGFGLFASLETKSPRIVNTVDWLDPVNEKTGKARYDWKQLLPIVAQVERLARRHLWLQKWKAAGPKRTIEGQIYGTIPHNETFEEDFEDFVVPAWKDAGLKGKPYCQLNLLWRESGEEATATVYLPQPGFGETRSLIVSRRKLYSDEAAVPGRHWLDNLSFRSDASVRQSVVVTPGGGWKLLTLPTRRKDKNKAAPEFGAALHLHFVLLSNAVFSPRRERRHSGLPSRHRRS